ncbi:MAG: HDOD domain-containing protein [Dehalococcoidia bacterium]|nr:HDOD domain-containing protein [Dehalococcoidia bacterium]
MQPYPTLDELVNQIGELRPIGAVATRILQLTESERFSAHELATVISSDQALTAKMLRLSNSAYYGFPRRITTVRDAVVLLGFRAVRSATLASCVIDAVPGSTHINYKTFWHFSVTVAMLAELLGRAHRAHQDEAFTAGIVHNIGRLALDQQAPQALQDALLLAKHHRADHPRSALRPRLRVHRRRRGAGRRHPRARVVCAAALDGAQARGRRRRRAGARARLHGAYGRRITAAGRPSARHVCAERPLASRPPIRYNVLALNADEC